MASSTVGLLNPGEMGASVGAALVGGGARVIWAAAGRSDATARRAAEAGLERVADVATMADGDRYSGLAVDERTDHPSHEWILALSPVRPGGERGLLRIDDINDYDVGDELEVLAQNELDDDFDASPAIAGDEIYLRGTASLYCIAR